MLQTTKFTVKVHPVSEKYTDKRLFNILQQIQIRVSVLGPISGEMNELILIRPRGSVAHGF